MAVRDIGPLRGADESLNHQIVDTFAVVSESDHAWTEKLWTSIASVDGSIQVNFGLGKYHNRGIVDGFAGVSRGREQWTVRASRELRGAPEDVSIGPLHYEVVEPLRQIRVRLEPNDVQPISFDVVLSGVTPPFFEDRNIARNARSGRLDVNLVRYHQGGWATGTVTVDGETRALAPESTFGFRDHSWGVRQSVGEPVTDLIGSTRARSDPARPAQFLFKWTPQFFRRADGSYYETAIFLGGSWAQASAYLNDEDGTQTKVLSVEPRLRYDPRTRFVRGGSLHLVTESDDERVIEVEALGETGFFLKPAGYGSWDDHIHGSWMGALHLAGEHIPDCWDDDHLETLGQLRDTPIRVREGNAVGYGIMESIISGIWPDLGLTRESDRRVSYA